MQCSATKLIIFNNWRQRCYAEQIARIGWHYFCLQKEILQIVKENDDYLHLARTSNMRAYHSNLKSAAVVVFFLCFQLNNGNGKRNRVYELGLDSRVLTRGCVTFTMGSLDFRNNSTGWRQVPTVAILRNTVDSGGLKINRSTRTYLYRIQQNDIICSESDSKIQAMLIPSRPWLIFRLKQPSSSLTNLLICRGSFLRLGT